MRSVSATETVRSVPRRQRSEHLLGRLTLNDLASGALSGYRDRSPERVRRPLQPYLTRRTIILSIYVREERVRVKTEKLTLRLEGELIERAKRTAEERGTSVSRMVAGFFESIEDPRATEEGSGLGEITRRLRGSVSPIKRTDGQDERDGRSADEQDYRRYLERKYG